MITLVLKTRSSLSGEELFGSYTFKNSTDLTLRYIIDRLRELIGVKFIPSYYNIPSPSPCKNEFILCWEFKAQCELDEVIVNYDPVEKYHGDILDVISALDSPSERASRREGKLKEALTFQEDRMPQN